MLCEQLWKGFGDMLKKMLVGLCVSAFLAAPVSAQQEVRPEGEGVLWAVVWAERNGECF